MIEIDAASRTGVDDVRELIEGGAIAPASARYKVYIIDEVHMLSKQAFNALAQDAGRAAAAREVHLRHDRDPHKVPVTILSRCQRFDLHRVPMER